jgi:hypothetical protein
MEKCRWAIGVILALVFLCWATSVPAGEEKTPPDEKAGAAGEAAFDMQETSLFDQKERAAITPYPMFGMQSASLSTEPAKEVKAYPKLMSKRPLYGSIVFNQNSAKPGSATRFYFVLDKSSAVEKAEEKAAQPRGDEPAVNKMKNQYDRLYFDFNHDLDLTNDAVVSPMKEPPKNLPRFIGSPPNAVFFDTINVPLGDDPKAKGQTVRVLPMMLSYGSGGRAVFMMAAARKGDVRLGKRAYSAMLFAQSGTMSRLDRPDTQLILTPVDGSKPTRSYSWMNTLGAIREADGEFYRISATPSGDKLTVRVVGGARGVFELSAGKKDVKPLGVVGLLRLKESMLLLGEMSYPMPSEQRATTATYLLPVGDYQPLILLVDYGDLQISLRADYTRGASKPVGSLAIRKDKPFVLDFATKPEVYFQAPPKEKTFKPGDEIRLAAMLRIPDKGLLIGGLDDMSKKIGEVKWMAEDGKQMTSPRYASLDPGVVITDSSGKKVAEGKMSFG